MCGLESLSLPFHLRYLSREVEDEVWEISRQRRPWARPMANTLLIVLEGLLVRLEKFTNGEACEIPANSMSWRLGKERRHNGDRSAIACDTRD